MSNHAGHLFLMTLLVSSAYSHSDHRNHIKDILYQHIPFLRTSTTDNTVRSTTEIPDILYQNVPFLRTSTLDNTVETTTEIPAINATEVSPLQQGTFEDFKESLGWSLGALISVPIVSLFVVCCFCYCLCKCCAAACSDDEKDVVVIQNQQPTAAAAVAAPIIVNNMPVPQMQPMQQYHPPPMQQYPGPQFQPQLYQQAQYSPHENYINQPPTACNQPTAPPSYDTKRY